MRRKRSLQSLTVTPKPLSGKDAANNISEPSVLDVATYAKDRKCVEAGIMWLLGRNCYVLSEQ